MESYGAEDENAATRYWLSDLLIELKCMNHLLKHREYCIITICNIVVLVYLLAVEWILLRVNLYRENRYAKVPLVHAKNSDFMIHQIMILMV